MGPKIYDELEDGNTEIHYILDIKMVDYTKVSDDLKISLCTGLRKLGYIDRRNDTAKLY